MLRLTLWGRTATLEVVMLVWLASYPRSGNTLVRVVLNDAFNIKTRALDGHGDDRVFSSRPGVIEAVGHVSSDKRGADLIEEAHRSDQLYILKTHEPPITDDPAIYIVRDGRSSVVSYYHYLNDVEKLAIPLDRVVAGEVYAGSWSDHFATWRPLERRRTLLLRYEEISKDIASLISSLSHFLSVQAISATTRSFRDLHRLYPEFFRGADDRRNIDELGALLPRFIELHGATMRRLGYID